MTTPHWLLYFHNKTERPITFVLFQENEILEEHSYSVVWYKATAKKDEKVGPIELPSDVFVSVNSETPGEYSSIYYFLYLSTTYIYKQVKQYSFTDIYYREAQQRRCMEL